jgi:maltose O-acetyltransferase
VSPSERDKMLAGELYLASDAELLAARHRARRLTRAHGELDPADAAGQEAVLRQLFGTLGAGATIEPPFACDYGTNIHAGARLYINVQGVILDCARVDIGDDVLMGPGVHLYTATHPLDAAVRASGLELARPIRIGRRVFLGGGTRVLPGVTIGDDTVVGAGSVVTRDLPPGVVAAGNPCRVLRTLS